MAKAKFFMKILQEIARLRSEAGRTPLKIATSAGVSHPSVQQRCRSRSGRGLEWPVLTDLARMRTELARKGVKHRLLWQAYQQKHPKELSCSAHFRDPDVNRPASEPTGVWKTVR